MVECSACGATFKTTAEFDDHCRWAPCGPLVDADGVYRHAIHHPKPEPAAKATAQRRTAARGGQEAEITEAPDVETR